MRTAILAAMFAAAAFGQEPVTFKWKGDIQARQALEIRNINGRIEADAAEGSQVELRVRITGTNPHPSTIRIDVVPHGEGILVCTIYEGITTPDVCAPEVRPSVSLINSDIRVEYFVKVPAEVRFAARTVNGRIRADLPASEISAATVNGRITVSTARPVEAALVNGSIFASLEGEGWAGARRFKTVNGSIDAEMPEAAGATVTASTVWGMITTDFPIRVHRWFIGSSMDGDINAGGPELEMRTVNGSIHLRKR